MFGLRAADDQGANQRRGREIEWTVDCLVQQVGCCAGSGRLRQMRMINQPCRDFHVVLDDLPRQSIFGDETCAQGFVARSEAVQRRFERGGIKWSSRAKNGGHVVQGGVWLKLIEKPKPLLAE